MRLPCLVVIAAASIGCEKPSRPAPPSADPVSTSASVAPVASTEPPSFTACGALDCRAYDDLASAFAATIADDPLVVAVGEAHAKKGFEWVHTSAKRFKEEVLPLLEGHASDLLLELMAPAQGCEEAKKGTSAQLAKIGKNQAAEAPNEYVALGKAAETLGIKVSQLHPSCAQLAEIAKSKSPNLTVLQTIRALIAHDASQAVAAKTDEKMFVIYGGAFHTEPDPPEERREFSFAEPVSKAAKGRYVSVHIFVREYIDQTWDIWQWYPQFDASQHRDKVVLLHPKPQHYVIVTAAAKPKT